MNETESTFVAHEACPSCGSKDNLARYSDGHAYCFGCQYREKGEGEVKGVDNKVYESNEPIDDL